MSKTKLMIDTEQAQQNLAISEVLAEADLFGLRWEFQMTAEKYLKEDSQLNILDAYQYALIDWIK